MGNAIAKGDSVQVQKLIITIIETIVIMIEMIEYRVTVIRKTENATERGKLSKSLEDELIFLTENIKILRESANISSILNSQLSKLVTESINKIETQVIYVEKDLKTEVEKVEIENITVDPCDETIPKDNADKAKEEKKDKQPAFNLPIPEHANDFMEVIEGGGFTLDDEEEDENPKIENLVTESINKTETQVMYVEKDVKAEVEKVEVENVNVDSCDKIVPKDNVDKANNENKDKPPTFNLPIPEHANDFMEVIEGGGFTLDDEEEDENPK